MKFDGWVFFGFIAQACFFARFLVQWVASELKKESHIPNSFWYLSVVGGLGLLIYAVHKSDPVFIVGNCFGVFIYLRNLALIRRKKTVSV
jgi:lipid-A-disaccharide synthase-like uncharacterized protein